MSALGDDPDPVDDAWRRASAADAGRPSAVSREAILARAAAVAAERRSPANASWFRRRAFGGALASLALVGVAVALWRESTREPAVTAAVTAAPAAPAPARPMAEAAPEAPLVEPSEARERSAERADSATRSLRAEAATQGLARARPEPATLAAAVQDAFPGLLQAERPPRAVWILEDAGRTVRSGLVDPGETYAELAQRLQQEMPDRRIGAFEVDVVETAGGEVQVGIAPIR